MEKRLQIEIGDSIIAHASIHTDRAPALSDLLWHALPTQGTLRHVRWSGEAAYILLDTLKADLPEVENAVSIYRPGAIILRPEHGELAFAYGQAQARDRVSRGALGCHLATVDSNLNAYLDALAQTRRGGGRPLLLKEA